MPVQDAFRPFHMPGQDIPLGTVSQSIAVVLTARGMVEDCKASGNLVLPDAPVTDTLEAIREILFAEGMIGPPRHEEMAVRLTAEGEVHGTVDRSVVRALGLWITKVHVNGLVHLGDGGTEIWLSRRARHAAWNPDRFDTMVAGGVAASQSVTGAVRAESWEEAGLTSDALTGLRGPRRMTVQYVSERGLHRELLVIHDLGLDPDFVPQCQDGEIAWAQRFDLDSMSRLLAIPSEMKFSSALVCRDLLARLPALGLPETSEITPL